MIKRCYISNCRETVNFSCNCSAETIFVCVPHKDLHTTQGAHDIKSILAPLSPDEKKESLAKIILLLSQFDQSRKKVTQNAQEIIKSVIKKSSKVLAKIAEIESNLRNFYNLAKQDKPVDTDQFKLIQNMPTSEIPTRVPLLKEIEESLSSLFDVHDYSHEDAIDPDECSQVLYSDGRFAGNMLSICLSEFKQKQLTFAPKVMGQGQVCRVDSHLYFFNGGSGISGRNGETYLVDIRNRTYETFQNSTPRCGGGSVYANNKVYVFGGYSERNFNTCTEFDLSTKVWTNLPELPMPMDNSTAGIVNGDIIISGTEADKIYKFQRESYLPILDAPAGFKLICGEWIVTENGLYENQDNDTTKWIKFEARCSCQSLWAYTSFKRGKFIYFIESNSVLWRVSTGAKKIETMVYS